MTASSSPAPQPASPPATEPSIGQLVSDASTHLSTIIRGEIELAKLELRSSVKNAGTGAGFFVGALVLLLFSLVYGFQALAEGIAALGVWRWLAFLIVFAFQVLAAGLLAFLGVKKVKRVRAPERTLKTTRETVDYLKKSRG
ncbi:MAG TPA: phage holin family protein [Jatrophihabitans sp.]|nr:phage holin family protein [Jatrophihabitans sp.]